jgi:type I restriction enzyme, S subunit
MKMPQGWKLEPLKNCCIVVSGSTPRRNKPEYWENGDIPWVTPKDLGKLKAPILDDAPEKITQIGYDSCSTTLLPKGSILFSSRAPIGHVAIAGRPMCTNQGFKSLVPKDFVDSSYLYWCMKQYAKNIEDLGSGSTFKEVSKSIIEKFEIPLPPLEEQKRIAAILDKADRVRRKRQEAIRLTEELGRSIFLDMFGEQHNYPKSLVGSICTVKGGKRLPIGHQLVSNDTGYPYIRAGNLKKGTTTGELLYLKQETHQAIKRYTISSDDVYITIVGAYIGDVGIIPIELDGANLTENAAKLVIKDNRVTNYFISYFLRSDIGQRQIKSKIKTTGQPKFALFRIEEIEIPIPPLEMQEKFQLIIENIDKNNCSMSVHYQESENLFNSLLQRAFRGEL